MKPLSDLPDFSQASMLIVGDVMLDSYWHGNTSRISPEAPVPVVHVTSEEARVGGAGNVALNAAVIGAKSYLLGLAGHDPVADQIEAMLAQQNVDCRLVRVPGSKTITKLRILSRHQQLIRADFEDHFPNWETGELLREFMRILPSVNVVVLSDYAKGVLRGSADLVSAARKAGKPVIIDPKGTDFERYRGATVITPNLAEFEAVVGRCATEEEIVRKGINLREALELEAVLVTRSEKGMTLLARGCEPLHLPTRAQEVYDVTGAGDTVVATLGAALAAGMDMPSAVALSNVAAGVVVAKLGTATVSPLELKRALQGSSVAGQRGVYDEADLLLQVDAARGKGERIVMTNGCFDILHPGHIDYLEKAKALGDRLIVAVNGNASVKRLKGEDRPVNSLGVRMRMLSALACVDWVVPFAEDTPARLIGEVLPDVLVKGGDYAVAEIAGGDKVMAAGGEVSVLKFVAGHSTSELINKIQKSIAQEPLTKPP
ncbi:bifunctional D-glycero-beta-D-manno-heptose-7-phosphate kinase/D-glycero-beta-D-manno-heptose 1-phosphate adenylyltransferase HldE [Crenobacter cavernae]|uniref:bifunctional D-glycero-beta-D-manno-heptose-7-phosphate kinase/D-glycero-beta-D-manno-heptose 1-phosphate adenylyltransferase HldE n=1 Tax=Crenobacter cavernae TaxID=2290923 RepID=UPI001C6A0BAA